MSEHKTNYDTPWRRLATAMYTVPKDGRVYGTMEIDITDAEQFVKDSRAAGRKITLTHLVVAALGRTIGHELPEVNCYIARGRFIPRDDVIVSVSVNMSQGQEMSSIRIRRAHEKTVFEIAEEVRTKAARSRQGTEQDTMKNKNVLASVPWPFRRWVFVLIKFFHHTLGIEFPRVGLSHDAFGSVVLSNIGSHGLSTGMAALLPAANVPLIIIMGKAEEKPVVRDGKIVIRTLMPFTATMDHRIMDGYHGGMMAYHMKKYLENPAALAEPPKSSVSQ